MDGAPWIALRSVNRAEVDWHGRVMLSYVRRHTRPDEIVRTDDGRTAAYIATLADRRVDNGLFWEVQQPELRRVLLYKRLNATDGVFVFTRRLPGGFVLTQDIGRWGIVIRRPAARDERPAAAASSL